MAEEFELRKVRSSISDHRGNSKPANEFQVWIAGEHRATWKRLTYKRGYWLQRADKWGGVRRPANRNDSIECASQDDLSAVTAGILPYIPTLADYAADEAARAEKVRQDEAEKAAQKRLWQIREAAPDLLEACELAIGSLPADNDHAREAKRRIQAAIDKATS